MKLLPLLLLLIAGLSVNAQTTKPFTCNELDYWLETLAKNGSNINFKRNDDYGTIETAKKIAGYNKCYFEFALDSFKAVANGENAFTNYKAAETFFNKQRLLLSKCVKPQKATEYKKEYIDDDAPYQTWVLNYGDFGGYYNIVIEVQHNTNAANKKIPGYTVSLTITLQRQGVSG